MRSAKEIDCMLDSLRSHGAAALVLVTTAVCSAADQPQFEIEEGFSNVFAGRESIFRFTVKNRQALERPGRLEFHDAEQSDHPER